MKYLLDVYFVFLKRVFRIFFQLFFIDNLELIVYEVEMRWERKNNGGEIK